MSSTTASSLEQALNLNDTFGSAFIGAMLMMILYGITCLQTYMYFVRYPKDGPSVKFLVLLIWVLDTFHVSLVSHTMYHYLVLNYANPAGLVDGVWSLYLSVGMNVLIAFIVQCFFTEKLHGLSGKNWWLTVTISFVVLAHLVFGLETMAELFIRVQLSRLPEITLFAAMPLAIAAVLADIMIAAALCFYLHNKRTAFRSTNMLLNYLIIYAVNRCLLTSAVAILEVILFAAKPKTFWFLAVDFVIGKCYANSLLATLNTRRALRGKGTDTEAYSFESSDDMGITHTSLQIAGVTPSMISRSRTHHTQSERVSLSFVPSRITSDASRTASDGKATLMEFNEVTELKEMSSTNARPRLSVFSAEEEQLSPVSPADDERLQESRTTLRSPAG